MTAPVVKSAQAPAGTYAWYVVLILMLAQTASFVDRMIMGLLVGPIRESFAISDTQYSLLAGLAFALFYSIMGLPLARIADRGNRVRLIAVAITFWSVMTAVCGLAKGFWSLFAARIGVGVGEAALSPAAYSMITDYFSKATLARALSVYTLGITIGSGLAYIVGGWVVTLAMSAGTVVLPVIGEREGWQLTFFLVGLPGLLIALLILMLREPQRRGLVNLDAGMATPGLPFSETLAFMHKRSKALFSHMFGVSLFIMVVFSLNMWGPEYLIRTFDFTRGEAGQTFGVLMMTAGTTGLLTGGALGDRWFGRGQLDGYSRVILLSMAGMLPFVIALGFITSPQLGIACMAIAVFFSAFQGGVSGGLIQMVTPNQMRGQVVAIFFLLANLIGMGLGPTVLALITDYVFGNDDALNKSIALCGAVLIPISALIMFWGLPAIRQAVSDASEWEQS